MNIESLFVLCANISSISIGGKVARESGALESTQNLAIFQTHAHSCAFRFFFSRSRAARWLAQFHSRRWSGRTLTSTPSRGKNIFSVDFWKASLVTHASGCGKYLSRQNIDFDRIRIRDPISTREKVSLSSRSRWWNEKNYVNSRKKANEGE